MSLVFYYSVGRITFRYTVPIVGMLTGSTISGMVVALTAVLKEVQENRDKVETYLAFGASRVEASIPIAQQALYIALVPVVNQMRYACLYRKMLLSKLKKQCPGSVTGIISIPGVMTGALLGGSSAEKAAKLQSKVNLFIQNLPTDALRRSGDYILPQC